MAQQNIKTAYTDASPAALKINAYREVDEIAKQLATFNQQIIAIEQKGTQHPTIALLKKQSLVLTRQIDHLRFSLGADR